MSHRLCYQQHPKESAGGAELILCCAVLCLLLDHVSSQETGHVTSLCPFAVGGSGEDCSGCPGLGQMSLVGLPCPGSGDSFFLPKPFLGDSALQDLKDAACFCFLQWE